MLVACQPQHAACTLFIFSSCQECCHCSSFFLSLSPPLRLLPSSSFFFPLSATSATSVSRVRKASEARRWFPRMDTCLLERSVSDYNPKHVAVFMCQCCGFRFDAKYLAPWLFFFSLSIFFLSLSSSQLPLRFIIVIHLHKLGKLMRVCTLYNESGFLFFAVGFCFFLALRAG